MKRFLVFFLIASSFLFLLGCVEQNSLVPPFTFSQLLSKGVDVNGNPLTWQGFLDGNYDGLCFQVFDVNHFGLKDCMSVDANIPWSQLINFPSGCPDNFVVKIVGASLVCVPQTIDTNWQTSWSVFDANMKSTYGLSPVSGRIPFSDGTKFSSDGNLYWDNTNKRLGIGTTSPSDILEVITSTATGKSFTLKGATYAVMEMLNTDASANARNWAILAPYTAYGTFEIRNSNAQGGDPLLAGTTRFMIDKDGKVGIGNTSPTVGLELGSTATGQNQIINSTESAETVTAPMVTGGWTLGSDGTGAWTITAGVLSKTVSAGSLTALAVTGMTTTPTAGRVYKVVIVVDSMSGSGTLYPVLGGNALPGMSVGTNTYYIVAGSTSKISIVGPAARVCSISSISVKELDSTLGKITAYGTADIKGQMILGESGASRPIYSFASSTGTGMSFATNSGWLILSTAGVGRIQTSSDGTILDTSATKFLSLGWDGPSLYNDGSGILGYRGGYTDRTTNTFNIYGGYTSSSNYVNRLNLTATTGILSLTAESAGARADTNISMALMPKGTGGVGIGTTSPIYKLQVADGNIGLVTEGNNGIVLQDAVGGSDTDYWLGKMDNSNGVDDDNFHIGKGSVIGTNPYITINNSGRVGIGTTSPATLLHVSGTNTNPATFRHTGDNYVYFDVSNTQNNLYLGVEKSTGGSIAVGSLAKSGVITTTVNDTALHLGPAQDVDMTILDSGNVGIGTANPSQKLDINGNVRIGIGATSGLDRSLQFYSKSNWPYTFVTSTDDFNFVDATPTTLMRITYGNGTTTKNLALMNGVFNILGASNGNVGIGTTTPQNKLNVVGDVNATSYKFTNGDANMYWDGTNLHFGQTTGIAYFDQNISSTGYLTRTDVYDKTQGTALSKIKDASEYKTGNKINHSAFDYSKVNYPVSVFDKMVTTTKEQEVCENQLDKCETDLEKGEQICTPQPDKCHTETITTQTPTYKEVQEEAVDLVKEVALIKQALYEIKACVKNGKDLATIKTCVGN